MAKFAGLRDPVTLDFENSTVAYCVDAFSISMGALMGTSPVTAFIESATGIAGEPHLMSVCRFLFSDVKSEGGRTGITAIVTGIMFFISIFFAPIFASIPSWATGSALVIVGSLMIRKWVAVLSPDLEYATHTDFFFYQRTRNQLGLRW
jgi:adenine/guanine/hypoxanthine permease